MIEHTPLDVAALAPAAQKALGPGPARMMAARGMAPLPPVEQAQVLYQLAIGGEPDLAMAARQTALGLPEKILAAAIGDAKQDPRVVDLFAGLVGDKPVVFEAIVGNAAVADGTIATLAGKAGAREVDRIAGNEQRLLRHPEIIAAMYMNKAARMSTVDRAVELAVRNNVRVPGLAAWDEIARALTGGAPAAAVAAPADDAAFAAIAASVVDDDAAAAPTGEGEPLDEEQLLAAANAPTEADARQIPIEKLSIPQKLRLATLGNEFARRVLVRDPVKLVAMAAIKSPGMRKSEAEKLAGNASLCDEVIRYIATRKEWTQSVAVKNVLCRNPKTPVTEAMRMLPLLREKDLNNIIKAKGVPSAIVAQARKIVMQRRGGDKK